MVEEKDAVSLDARSVPQVQQINVLNMEAANDATRLDAQSVPKAKQINVKHMVVVENYATNQDVLLWPTLVANA
jgi:hypothetical protein